MAFDQFDNASRVSLLNAGRELLPRHFLAPRVAELLQTMLADPIMAASCRRLAGALAHQNGVSTACDILLQHLGTSEEAFPVRKALTL